MCYDSYNVYEQLCPAGELKDKKERIEVLMSGFFADTQGSIKGIAADCALFMAGMVHRYTRMITVSYRGEAEVD